MESYIGDGYQEAFYIAAEDGIHGPLEGEYRPAIGKLADKITSLMFNQEWDAFWDQCPKALARDPKLLKSWSLLDRKGNPVPITEDVLKNGIRQQLVHKVWLIVSGHRASDPKPGCDPIDKPNLEADLKN